MYLFKFGHIKKITNQHACVFELLFSNMPNEFSIIRLKTLGHTLFHKPFIVIFFNSFILKEINRGLIFVYKKL